MSCFTPGQRLGLSASAEEAHVGTPVRTTHGAHAVHVPLHASAKSIEDQKHPEISKNDTDILLPHLLQHIFAQGPHHLGSWVNQSCWHRASARNAKNGASHPESIPPASRWQSSRAVWVWTLRVTQSSPKCPCWITFPQKNCHECG